MIVYRCDKCGRVVTTVITSASEPVGGSRGSSDEAVYISWKIEQGTRQREDHLCRACIAEAFAKMAERYGSAAGAEG